MSSSHAQIVVTKIPPDKPTNLGCGNKNTTMDKGTVERLLEGLPVDLRELKALEIAARCKISFADGCWLVPSQTTSAKYRVTIGDPPSCTCDDFNLRAQPCKHVIAAKLVCERDHGGKAPEIATDAVPVRPTYKQDWPRYDLAQRTEKRRFQALLFDLCRGLDNLPQTGKPGRRWKPMADMVFACAFKVYSGFSSRRFQCDLDDALAQGYLSESMHSVRTCAYFDSEFLTPVLQALIVRSSLPLKAVETTFAPDSTGFSTSRFIRWFDEKYGTERSGKDWVKVHIMTGVKTNIITAAEIHGRDANDSPIMPSLLQTTKTAGFDVREVPADKGYSSVENIEAIVAAGASPYIPFKSSATGASGGLWEKMYFYYQFQREAFLGRYHQRSNVESTFSMVKAKFRDHVRSKTDTAMKNEVLCKLLCHNIVVIHQSHIELGIEPIFWPGDQDEPDGRRDVLPLARPS
jgi:transposase